MLPWDNPAMQKAHPFPLTQIHMEYHFLKASGCNYLNFLASGKVAAVMVMGEVGK